MGTNRFGALTIMGGGNMAEAIVRGGISAGVLDAARIIICEPSADRRALFKALGVRATDSHAEALAAEAAHAPWGGGGKRFCRWGRVEP